MSESLTDTRVEAQLAGTIWEKTWRHFQSHGTEGEESLYYALRQLAGAKGLIFSLAFALQQQGLQSKYPNTMAEASAWLSDLDEARS